MNDFKQRLTSRKFLLTLGAILTSLGAGLAGEVTWFQAIIAITTAVLGYVGVEGVADANRAKWTKPINGYTYTPSADPLAGDTSTTPAL